MEGAWPFKGPASKHRRPRRRDVPGPPRPEAARFLPAARRHLSNCGGGASERGAGAVVPAPSRLPGLLSLLHRVRPSRPRQAQAPASGTLRGGCRGPRGPRAGGRAAPAWGRGRGARTPPALAALRIGLGRRVTGVGLPPAPGLRGGQAPRISRPRRAAQGPTPALPRRLRMRSRIPPGTFPEGEVGGRRPWGDRGTYF